MESPESGSTSAAKVDVKALATFFQRLECRSQETGPRPGPAESLKSTPADNEASQSPVSLRDVSCQTSEGGDVIADLKPLREGLQTSCRPVPQPRISILRKQSQSTCCTSNSHLRASGRPYCHSLSSDDSFVFARGRRILEQEENEYESNYDDEEDIYEELPAEYHCGSKLSCDTSHRKNSRSKSLGSLILRSKILSSRILREEKGRKAFFPFTRSKETRDLPKPPPSIKVVNASIEQLNKQVVSNPDQTAESYHGNDCSEPYYDVRELLGSDAGASQSDDYYESISSPLSDSDGIYEEVYGSVESDATYESLPFQAYASCDRVEYVEIDARKTAELEAKIQKEQKLLEKRQKEESEKLRRKYNVTGQEVPVNYGIVKQDAKRTKLNLRVKKGEVVLVLRMEDNPPGLWLAKNERSEVGYVQLANISFDADVVKALMHVKSVSD